MTATEKLLPCPFCGGEAIIDEGQGFFWVTCGECFASGAATGEKQAIAAWNTRSITAAAVYGYQAAQMDDGSRYYELFGTPECMARFIIENCCCDCQVCPLPNDCPCRASYAADEEDYDPVLEWLRGDA